MVRQIGCAPYTILYIAVRPPEGLSPSYSPIADKTFIPYPVLG